MIAFSNQTKTFLHPPPPLVVVILCDLLVTPLLWFFVILLVTKCWNADTIWMQEVGELKHRASSKIHEIINKLINFFLNNAFLLSLLMFILFFSCCGPLCWCCWFSWKRMILCKVVLFSGLYFPLFQMAGRCSTPCQMMFW